MTYMVMVLDPLQQHDSGVRAELCYDRRFLGKASFVFSNANVSEKLARASRATSVRGPRIPSPSASLRPARAASFSHIDARAPADIVSRRCTT